MKSNKILSVCLMTYNHVNYIRGAIESVLSQKTDYSYELIIGEDFSTDGTRDIVLNYAAKYPEIIRLAKSACNLGMVKNFLNTLNQCNGKYIALIEGDDKWLDINKINTQLNFMEVNPEFSLSCHNAWVKNERKRIPAFKFNKNLSKIDFEDIIMDWRIPTASIIFRKDALIVPDWFENMKNWD
ncbi:MAG TPA: glycosyltransferase, partial [Ignavibacteria bacterium]